jgi:histidinol-phosphate aminotransferase
MAKVQPGVTRRLRGDLARLRAYPAPVPLEEFARSVGVAPEQVLKLDQNENPFGCSPRVREALAAFPWYHVYPDPDHRALRAGLSRYVGVPADWIVVGNGGDEIIELILRLFVEPGDGVISAAPTFGYYETAALVAGASYRTVPRGPQFEVDVAAVAAAVDARTKVIFLANPNNPTGNATPLPVIRGLLALGPLVVVDEAYFEYCGQTAVGLLADEAVDNLVVLRTFSKWAGLAGLRLGYGIFPPALLPAVAAVKSPYSVSQAAELAGIVSLEDAAYLLATVEQTVRERERLRQGLAALPWLSPYPSEANFLLCAVSGSAADLQADLARRAILVRRYNGARLDGCLRISVGRPEQNDRLLAALQEWSTHE